ncbi:unnamed protein product [Protopolystoma xenopodis]|uniref:P-type ATPase N-terminal domain-containing protein n=1 Tax=Protopolystoma xenopodis TaxID=117903 RepID=A0A448X6Y5_9PLAT|nr:unnamed protein product [Protopolystoma xenopodis]
MPEVNAFAKEVAPIPVVIVLAITGIKDAYEDFCRYRADKKVNNALCQVYCPNDRCYVKDEWSLIRPGDFVRLHANEVIPADILVLSSSDLSGICHIETANLDGENNLKQREIVKIASLEVSFV